MMSALWCGEWTTSGDGDYPCTVISIPAGARYVLFDLDIDDTEDDDYDLYVYFPTRTDCSVYDCRPDRSGGWDETCGPYNPVDYDPTSTCGAAAENWRVMIEEVGYTYWGWDLTVTWVDCNVGNNCSTPIVVELPEDMAYNDYSQWTTGRVNDWNNSCLEAYDEGEDVFYQLNVDRPMVIDITLDPHGTAGTGFCLDNACPPDGSCLAMSTNPGAGSHSVTDISLSAGTYYIMVDYNPAIATGGIPNFDLIITSPRDCSEPINVTLPADLPYTSSNQFTCGRLNHGDESCLDGVLFDYDSGEDLFYRITVTESVVVNIELDPGGIFSDGTPGTGFALDEECPPSGDCIDYATNLLPGVYGLYNVRLGAGTYYIMVDSDEQSADCIPDFNLTITEGITGATCSNPIPVSIPGELPYYDSYQTTCEMTNDYGDDENTCLHIEGEGVFLNYYDQGQDIIYRLSVTSDVVVDIELEPLNTLFFPFLVEGSSIAISYDCPLGAVCIDTSTESGDDAHGLYGITLLASVGTYYIMIDCDPMWALFLTYDCFDFNLSITEAIVINNPPNPTTTANPCGPQTLTRVGSVPSGETWYWQGTTCGTRTDLGSGVNYTANASGTYYIRSYHAGYDMWSPGCGSVTVTVNEIPNNPSPSATPTSVCYGSSTNLTATVSGATIYWYTGSCGGTYIGSGSPLPVSPAATTTYYAKAQTGAGCLSTGCGSVTVTVYNNYGEGIWTGYADNNWSNPQNWGGCLLPTASTDVSIPAVPAYGRFPTINTSDGSCVCHNVVIDGTLNGGSGKLFVHGNWTNNSYFNAGTSTVFFVGDERREIHAPAITNFYYIKTENEAFSIDLEDNFKAEEIDLLTPGNEGIDIQDDINEIDLTD